MEEYLQVESGIVLKCIDFNVQKIVLDDSIIETKTGNVIFKIN